MYFRMNKLPWMRYILDECQLSTSFLRSFFLNHQRRGVNQALERGAISSAELRIKQALNAVFFLHAQKKRILLLLERYS